jgi:hypothetical protein
MELLSVKIKVLRFANNYNLGNIKLYLSGVNKIITKLNKMGGSIWMTDIKQADSAVTLISYLHKSFAGRQSASLGLR